MGEILIDDGEHEIWPPADYTGEWSFYWPNGAIKYKAIYLGGEPEGEVICYWDNGQIAQRGVSDCGMCVGIWEDFWEDGTKFKETEYRDNHNFQVRWYGCDGELTRIEEFENRIKVSERKIE